MFSPGAAIYCSPLNDTVLTGFVVAPAAVVALVVFAVFAACGLKSIESLRSNVSPSVGDRYIGIPSVLILSAGSVAVASSTVPERTTSAPDLTVALSASNLVITGATSSGVTVTLASSNANIKKGMLLIVKQSWSSYQETPRDSSQALLISPQATPLLPASPILSELFD